MMKNSFLLLVLGVVAVFFAGCHTGNKGVPADDAPEFVMLDAAAYGRDIPAREAVPVSEVSGHLQINSTTHFELWKSVSSVTIDSTFVPEGNRVVSARVLPKIYIFPDGAEQPQWWSVIDLSTSFALGPQRKTLLVLPVGSQKSISSPVSKLKWATLDQPWPFDDYYSIVPAGKYQFMLVLEIYDDDDQLIDVMKTEKVSYESVSSQKQ